MILGEDEKAVVVLDSFEKLEYVHKSAVLSLYGSPKDIFKDKRPIRRYFKSIGRETEGDNVAAAIDNADFVAEVTERSLKRADGVVTLWSDGYPERLKNTPVPPLALYYRGDRELLSGDKIFAVVGSRKTLKQYAVKAEEISERLAESGVTVVSGLAEGADMAAIGGGLKSGKVISVFAGGVDCVYPKANAALADKIAEKGLIVSEHPCGVSPKFYYFPVRNRIIAGLSDGVLIVSGSKTSGARHTAAYAADYGREVFCLPYGLGEQGELCKYLLKNGAVLAEAAEDISAAMGYELKEKTNITLNDEEKVVYELIKGGTRDTDDIILKSGSNVERIMQTLTMLELKRLIVKCSDSSYVATDK